RRRRPCRGTSSCSRPPVPASTSSATTSTAARSSHAWPRRRPIDVDVLEARARARRLARLRQAPAVEYHLLLLVTLGLVAFGLIMVYSASSGVAVVQGQNPMGPLLKQVAYAVGGTVMMAIAAWVPYRRW